MAIAANRKHPSTGDRRLGFALAAAALVAPGLGAASLEDDLRGIREARQEVVEQLGRNPSVIPRAQAHRDPLELPGHALNRQPDDTPAHFGFSFGQRGLGEPASLQGVCEYRGGDGLQGGPQLGTPAVQHPRGFC